MIRKPDDGDLQVAAKVQTLHVWREKGRAAWERAWKRVYKNLHKAYDANNAVKAELERLPPVSRNPDPKV